MAIINTILIIFFVIVAALLILLVLVQNEDGDSLGGIFAGGSSSAFGSRSGNVLTRATSILGGLFLLLSFGMALLNRGHSSAGVEDAVRTLAPTTEGNRWWEETETAPTPLIEIPPADSETEAMRLELPPLSPTEEGAAAPAELQLGTEPPAQAAEPTAGE